MIPANHQPPHPEKINIRLMKNLQFTALAAALALLGACQMPQQKPNKPETGIPKIEPQVFFETTSISGASFSPDASKIIYSSDESGIFNIYSRGTTDAAAAPVQLTNSTTNATFAICYFPEDERILYSADQGGNELTHLHVREQDGAVRDLTPGANLKAEFAGWAADNKSFFVMTNERDPKFNDIYRYYTDRSRDYAREMLFQNRESMSVAGVSPNGQWIALIKLNSNSDSNIYLFDTREPDAGCVMITSHEGEASHAVEAFSTDSKELYYYSNVGTEFQYVSRFRMADSSTAKLYSGDWDISEMVLSRDGRKSAILTNVDAVDALNILNEKMPVALPALPRGQYRSFTFSADGRKAGFVVSGDREPSNLYILDLDKSSALKLTNSLSPAIRRDWLTECTVVRYKSFDGLEIPALLYRPAGVNKDWKAPAIVYVHGGPGGQTLVQYSADIQILVNHGYAVLAVNNRGSSGYGKKFFHLDDKKHGDVDLKDCTWGRRYLASLDWVDAGNIAIMGGSYGGYMVAAALAFDPDSFDCGIDIFGVTNWVRTLKSIPAWWEAQRKSLYDEIGDPTTPEGEAALRAKSPLFHAKNIKKPLLVVQGKNDPRVLEAESREIVEAVRQNGVPVEYVLFDDEGHGFRNRKNRIRASFEMLRFLDRHLKSGR